MLRKNKFLFTIIATYALFFPAEKIFANSAPVISLNKVMQLAEKNSNFLSEQKMQEIISEKSINVAKAAYFPTLNAQAIDSNGFPASNNLLGISGIMGSPFRSGLAGGVVLQQTVYDFGRTAHSVKEARFEKKYSEENTKVTEYQVKQLALETFYDCENFKTQHNVWKQLRNESGIITKEANHFVKTGQRSIVDGYLSQAQTKQALTAQAFYAARLNESINELSIIIGVSKNSFSCPILSNNIPSTFNSKTPINSTAIVMRAISKSKIADEKVAREKANYYPKIVVEASTGSMQKSRLVPINDYAVGVGLTMPLFDMSTYGKVDRAEAQSSAELENVEAKKQYIEEMNGKYDEVINSDKIKIKYLSQELALANKAFSTAKRRYFSLQGTLVDLREAFNNLARTQTDIDTTRAELLKAKGAKALLNGRG